LSQESEAKDFVLNKFFPYKVRTFYRAVSDAVKNVYVERFGLGIFEWRTMAVLNEYEPLPAKEIVARSSLDKVNVSRAIAGLQKSKLLERHIDPTDRRRVLLRLTPKGKKTMKEVVPLVLEVEKQVLCGLSQEEREQLLSLMAKVERNALLLEKQE